ncbi:S-type pyocin domain-containing protein [Pseudomonas sp. PB106]|uniref:S-type pyocin domain-containing protein n=1 Tax=Pseudomonas sp. PB106 TaxID=2494699 RepID=UPI00131CC1BF|nr:S-type pyocin domain-containing protein [Pseudomonas sp. PB106]KAE9640547.1 colicin transporter [Pseudomonas sp. PB106]
MQKPTSYEIDPIVTTAVQPPGFKSLQETEVEILRSGVFGTPGNHSTYEQQVQSFLIPLPNEFAQRSAQINQTIEADLARVRLEGSTHALPPAESIIRELAVRNTVIQRKNLEFQQHTSIAQRFYGEDPLGKTAHQFLARAATFDRHLRPNGPAFTQWRQSYRSAHEARLLTQTLAVLHQQQINVQNWLNAVQANNQTHAAAAETQRLAAERARIAAEQQRLRAVAEKARRDQEEIRVREQERLATLAKKQRRDAHLAHVAADIARQNIEKETQERDRIATLKAALVEAEFKADAAAKEFVVEQNRLQAETQARIDAIQQQLETEKRSLEIRRKVIDTATSVARRQAQLATSNIQQQNETEPGQQPAETVVQLGTEGPGQDPHTPEFHQVYPALGAIASTQPSLSFSSASVRLAPATSKAILAALRVGVATLTAIGTVLLSPVVVGFAALVMPSRLGNGERFALSVPLAELSSVPPQTLRDIADRQGTLEMPVGLGVRPLGSGTEVFVSTADNFHIRSSVLVLNAAYDLLNDVYEAVLPDSPTDFLTWTPINSPDNSSTESPMVDTDPPDYSGATIIPVEGRLDLNPILVEGWERFIIVFPDDSGIAPLYVVFSNPYGGVADGEHSGRSFNPEETGLPVTRSDWAPAIIANNGVNIVKLHTSKFLESDANKIMIDRLERISRGELEVTDTDKRFYTHEIREFERLKALGYGDTEMPDPDSSVWNDVHTATLEDYKLNDDPALLYTPEALEAARRQEERDYQKFLKELW